MDLYDPPSPVIFWCPEKLSFNVNMFQQGFSFPPLIFLFMFCFFVNMSFSPIFSKKIPTWIEDPFSPLTKDKISFKVLRTMVLDLNPVADELNESSMLVKGRCVWMNIDAPNMNCKAKIIEFCCFSRCKFVRVFSLKKRTALKWVLNGRVCSDYFHFSQWPNSY